MQVTTVDMQKPPPDFRTNFEATHPPILIDNGLAILENDKIERHIMKSIPGGYNLFVQVIVNLNTFDFYGAIMLSACFLRFAFSQDKEVATLIENIYSKLKLMLVKKDENKNNALLGHLRKINDHLLQRGTRFLTGDTMCCFDCELMPRLQHIRVAAKYFVDFEIPVSNRFIRYVCASSCERYQLVFIVFAFLIIQTELTALWRYMYHMYQLDAFTQSCPADQDIINHYKLQQVSMHTISWNLNICRIS